VGVDSWWCVSHPGFWSILCYNYRYGSCSNWIHVPSVQWDAPHIYWETQLDPLRKSLLKTTHDGCWFWEQRGHSCLVQGHSSHQALFPSHLASAWVSWSLNLEMCLIPVQQGDWLFMQTYVAVVCVRLTLQLCVSDLHCSCLWRMTIAGAGNPSLHLALSHCMSCSIPYTSQWVDLHHFHA
jgi:hypothetical protein